MYKVLIADDEDIIRRGLAGMVAQHKSLQVAAMAEDGEIALKLAQETRPDVMLVDINMPFMNGFEFISGIQKILPDAMIVIVTGYDDFEFVQKALQLGVADYVLKPVMEEPFFAVLDKVVKRLDGLRKSRKYLSWIEDQMEQNRPTMINAFFIQWLDGQLDRVEITERMSYLKINMPEPYMLTVLQLCDNNELDCMQRGTDWDDNLLYFGCRNITEEVLGEVTEPICFRTEEGAMAVITEQLPGEQGKHIMEKLVGLLEENLYVKAEITQARGEKLSDFPDIFETAMDSLRERRQYSATVLKAVSCIEKQWGSRDLSLQAVADSLFITPQYPSRLFSRETGETFGTCLGRKRMSEAMRLLQDPGLKMYEIAEKTGYASQHYFSSAFKKALGMSPAEYRKRILKQGDAE